MTNRPPSHLAAPDPGVRTNDPDATRAPAWYWWGLGIVLVASLLLSTWALSRNGLGNTYYTAAALSGAKSWKAAFLGSLDTRLFITIDKPAPWLWTNVVTVRLFGLSSWSLLLPYALAGTATVLLLANLVRRIWGPPAALLAAIVLATTPVFLAVDRSNLPEPMLILCLVASAWALVRGLESGRTPWLLAAMILVGFGFNAKLLQAWIILPALGLSWLAFAPVSLRIRIAQGFAAVAAVLVASFWWGLLVDYAPWGTKPYIGGSSDGSFLGLVVGYAGLGRVFGGESNLSGSFFDGGPGVLRMFNAENGGQIAWLLPLAAICLIAVAVQAGRERDRLRLGATTVWGLWLAVHLILFSSVKGIYHPYYTAALAPAIAALVGAGAAVLWQNRNAWEARAAGAAGVVGTGWLAVTLLDRVPSWHPWLGPTILVLSAVAAVIIVGLGASARLMPTAREPAARAAFVFSVVVVLLAPAFYATTTLTSPPSPLPHAGPNGVPMSPAVLQFKTANQTSVELLNYLRNHWEGERWVVASLGSSTGASLIIDLDGAPVMVMGGFTGLDDPVPTVAELEKYASTGQLRFILVPTRRGSAGMDAATPPTNGPTGVPRQTSHLIEAAALIIERYKWMADNCTPVDPASIGGPALDSRLYDCARRPTS